MNNAKTEIEESEVKIEDAKKEIEKNTKKANTEFANAEKQIKNAEEQITIKEKELQEGKKALEENRAQANAGIQQLENAINTHNINAIVKLYPNYYRDIIKNELSQSKLNEFHDKVGNITIKVIWQNNQESESKSLEIENKIRSEYDIELHIQDTQLVFFLMIRRPPRSTLFPFTMLFRFICRRVATADEYQAICAGAHIGQSAVR